VLRPRAQNGEKPRARRETARVHHAPQWRGGVPKSSPNPPILFLSCKNIRLSSDVTNRLSWSRNWRADGDGCSACTMQVSRRRAQGFNGLHGWKRVLASIVERSHPDYRKPVRRSFRFNRVTGERHGGRTSRGRGRHGNEGPGGATAGDDRKMNNKPLEREPMNNEPLEREPIDRARARLEALLKANAAPRCDLKAPAVPGRIRTTPDHLSHRHRWPMTRSRGLPRAGGSGS
jgi:hypothetical protein